jgi:uncharacterized protein DUF222
MSELRSALDEVGALDFAQLPDGRLEEEFAELQRARRVLEAQLLRCLAEIDRRASFQADGYVSTASWLQDRYRGGAVSARDQVRTARALREMPGTEEAFTAGELSQDAVKVLAAAHEGRSRGLRRSRTASFGGRHSSQRTRTAACRGLLEAGVGLWSG